jgi:transcriptional regulator with XRE-family HTH domain
MGRED